MLKHQYCCQNTAQNYLDHIITVPDDFNINPACLNGITKLEFIKGLKQLTDIVRDIYNDIISNPSEYGFGLVEDVYIMPVPPKMRDSYNAPNKIILFLYIAVNSGELTKNGIFVNQDSFINLCKEKRATCFKATNYKVIFNKLRDFGFTFENFILDYPDDRNIIRILYGYMKNAGQIYQGYDALFSLNYHITIAPENRFDYITQNVFAQYFKGVERELFEFINEKYIDAGFYCKTNGDFRLNYHINPQEKKRSMDIWSDYGKLKICCKLYNIGEYVELIDKMPDRIKNIFKCVKDCCVENCLYKRNTCICRVDYTIDEHFYKACTFEYFYQFDNIQMEDMNFFKTMFSIEAIKQQEASKRKK